MPEDVQLIKSLGIKNYRFSISWPRILPDGRGAANSKGLAFYDHLVDELLKADISPCITLNHWDLPQTLEEQGGWSNRDTVDRFVDYADILFKKMGDRVTYWITHNEPWVTAFLGQGTGIFAPGVADYSRSYQTAHHLLLSHGKAVLVFQTGSLPGTNRHCTQHKLAGASHIIRRRPGSLPACFLEQRCPLSGSSL